MSASWTGIHEDRKKPTSKKEGGNWDLEDERKKFKIRKIEEKESIIFVNAPSNTCSKTGNESPEEYKGIYRRPEERQRGMGQSCSFYKQNKSGGFKRKASKNGTRPEDGRGDKGGGDSQSRLYARRLREEKREKDRLQ